MRRWRNLTMAALLLASGGCRGAPDAGAEAPVAETNEERAMAACVDAVNGTNLVCE